MHPAQVESGYMDEIRGAADGQPAWLHGWFTFWINLQAPRATFFAYLVAVIETAIALALIFGFARKLSYISAIVLSLLIWAMAEGFGGPYTSGRRTSARRSSTRSCSPRCWRSTPNAARPTTAWTRSSSDGSRGGTRSPRLDTGRRSPRNSPSSPSRRPPPWPPRR